MKIRIYQIELPPGYSQEQLLGAAAKKVAAFTAGGSDYSLPAQRLVEFFEGSAATSLPENTQRDTQTEPLPKQPAP